MTIESERKRIDKIDEKIFRLLRLRAKTAIKIAKKKRKLGKKIFDKNREAWIISKFKKKKTLFTTLDIEKIFRSIITASKNLQNRQNRHRRKGYKV